MQLVSYERRNEKNNRFRKVTGNKTEHSLQVTFQIVLIFNISLIYFVKIQIKASLMHCAFIAKT